MDTSKSPDQCDFSLKSIDDLCKNIQKSVVAATKAANGIPLVDFGLYQTYPSFSKVIDYEKKTISKLLNRFIKSENPKKSFSDKSLPQEQLDCLIDLNDLMLDRVGHALDEFEGLKKKDKELIVATLNVSTGPTDKSKTNLASWNKKSVPKTYQSPKQLATNIAKSQLNFKQPIDNSNNIFKPIIQFKHNAIRPLSLLEEYDDEGQAFFPHPYEHEITSLNVCPSLLSRTVPAKPVESSKRALSFIDTVPQLLELIKILLQQKEIAVDLEYHNYRSFLGFTCLIQISTRTQDFLIDAIELRHELHVLNEPFTDPKILKVFHGADMDIQWLQKDFGVYVVRMFDTYQAARALKLPQCSLFYLAKHYCEISLNKQYQLADWRVRPLPQNMLEYAREDTRNLLYIYDIMKNELLSNNKGDPSVLIDIFKKSDSVCLKRFEKPLLNNTSYLPIINRCKTNLNNQQIHAIKELYAWRDELARKEDESTGYILPNHMLLKIAEVLPREAQGILACCNPIPVMVRNHLNELHLIILRARDLPLEPDFKNINKSVNNLKGQIDISNTMDHFDDDHLEQSQHECLLDLTEELQHKVILSRNTISESSASSLWKILARSNEKDPYVSKLAKDYVSPYQKYVNYQNKLLEESKNKTEAEVVSKEVKPVVNENQILITNSKKKARTEAEYDNLMIHKPIKELIKAQTVGQKSSPNNISESLDQLLDEVRIQSIPTTSGADSQANGDDDNNSLSDSSEDNDEPKDKMDSDNYQVFSLKTNTPDNYFDPTKEFLSTKQKNKSFTSRTKRKKQIIISSASTKKARR